MTKKEALDLVGGLSNPSKMPCKGYSIPAQRCHVGQKLRDIKNSVCSKCYALKGMYSFPKVKEALERRFQSLSNPLWTAAMTVLIKGMPYFRWHDSGDLQSVEHLENIVQIAKNCPETKFWLPTREYSIVSDFNKKHDSVPENLIIRISGLMLDGATPLMLARQLKAVTSGVSKENYNCPASKQEGKCMDCRNCWDKSIEVITYKQH